MSVVKASDILKVLYFTFLSLVSDLKQMLFTI